MRTEGGTAMQKNIFTDFNKDEEIHYMKTYMFIKGYAVARDYDQTLIALAVARHMHDGQHRKEGLPYITHPLKVCSTLIIHGVKDDITLAAALLHDVLEDCQDKLPLGGKELLTEYGLDGEVLDIVKLLTKKSGLTEEELTVYFKNISKNPKALIIKLADRLHNSSTLYIFSPDKLKKYIKETNTFILPMASYGKNYYPRYTNIISGLKNSIFSMNHSMEIVVSKYDESFRQMQDTIVEQTQEIITLKELLKAKNIEIPEEAIVEENGKERGIFEKKEEEQ